jgi:hypothetical protein
MFPSFLSKLTQIGCRIFRLTEASVSRSSLSAMMTYKHVYSMWSSTYPQLIDEDREPGGPDKSSLAILGPMAPEDPRARITSPGAVRLGIPRPVPFTTKS